MLMRFLFALALAAWFIHPQAPVLVPEPPREELVKAGRELYRW